MSSRFPNRATLLLILLATAATSCRAAAADEHQPMRLLRVCADPNNLPFSNDRLEGFENRLADLVAGDLGARVEYVWWAERRGFIRNTLNAHACDAIMGVPSRLELVKTTRPYYRSSYVFVTRAGDPLPRGFDDEVLRTRRVGVHLIGDDFANTPPAHALSARGIIANVRGFSIYGNYREPNPPAALIRAVAAGEIDIGIAWGPLAGYFAARSPVPLHVRVVPSADAPASLPFAYEISMAVRHDDEQLGRELDRVIQSRQADIDRLLDDFSIPRLGAQQETQ